MFSDGSRKGEIRAGASGRIRCPTGVEHFVAGLERRSVPPKSFIWNEEGKLLLGVGALSVLIPSLPLPSTPFRCIPSTDGGSEARCQQGSEQPFPGALPSLAPPSDPSLPVPGSSSCLLCAPALTSSSGTNEGGCGALLLPLPVGLTAFNLMALCICWNIWDS